MLVVQLPLMIKYSKMIKADPQNLGLKGRIVALPVISMSWFLYSSAKFKTTIRSCYDKYLHELSDFEIDNFDSMYEQAKQSQN